MSLDLREAVAWRVKDFADGWILFHSKADADLEAEGAGNLVEPLFPLSERLALLARVEEVEGERDALIHLSDQGGVDMGLMPTLADYRHVAALAHQKEAALRASQEALKAVAAMLDRYNAPTTDDGDGSLLSLANRIEAKVYADAVAAAKFVADVRIIEPHLDAVICYASDINEHPPNGAVMRIRQTLAQVEGGGEDKGPSGGREAGHGALPMPTEPQHSNDRKGA